YAVSPGYSSESLYLYYANDFEFVEQNLDSDEQLEVEWIDKRKALHMAKTGEIRDGKTLVALLWYIANRDEF
ncbi:MAG: NUDIX hydrolase, partial [Clostridia bacterium]|nr:NUDIX hydrolase [Clostridia bacterium]